MKRIAKEYTLIELLLLIALLVAITVSGMVFYRQRSIQLKIEKTALQMQQWLQASMAYYVDHGVWPKKADDLLQDLTKPNKPYYLSVSIKKNPWGFPYVLQAIEKNHLMEITVHVPTFAGGNPLAYAQRVAARLPNAQVTADTATPLVSVQMNVLGEMLNNTESMKIFR